MTYPQLSRVGGCYSTHREHVQQDEHNAEQERYRKQTEWVIPCTLLLVGLLVVVNHLWS